MICSNAVANATAWPNCVPNACAKVIGPESVTLVVLEPKNKAPEHSP
ncbi:MAG: hypothetical protein ACK4PR_06360 [Gammaproteobacteria bacterium]